MQNLKNIEGNYNAHLNAFEHAFVSKKDCHMAYENGYLNAIEYLLQQLGVDYKIDTAGYMTIEVERN